MYRAGTLLLAEEGSLALPWGNLYSLPLLHVESGRHTRRTRPLIPGTWAESTEVFPRDFQRQISFFLEGWQPGRGDGKERRLPLVPRTRGKLDGK